MNKLFAITLALSGLLLSTSPAQAGHDDARYQRPAAAHHQRRLHDRDRHYNGSRHYRSYRRGHRDYNDHHGYRQHARRAHMPNWLRLRGSFRHWYRHSLRRHDRFLSWYQLYDIYQWEHSRHRYHRYYSY
jgi:hypothetical protein